MVIRGRWWDRWEWRWRSGCLWRWQLVMVTKMIPFLWHVFRLRLRLLLALPLVCCNPRWVPFSKAYTRRTQRQWTLRSLAALHLGLGRFQGVFRQGPCAVTDATTDWCRWRLQFPQKKGCLHYRSDCGGNCNPEPWSDSVWPLAKHLPETTVNPNHWPAPYTSTGSPQTPKPSKHANILKPTKHIRATQKPNLALNPKILNPKSLSTKRLTRPNCWW